MRGDPWSKEDIETLKRLWRDGVTAVEIGIRLGGKSRSAVLGKVFRLRLPPNDPGGSPAMQKPGQRAAGGAVTWRRNGAVREKLSAQATAKPAPRAKSLLELTNDCCRWPFRRPGTSKFFFCGNAGADLERGIPYCEKHMRRAYVTETIGLAQPQRSQSRRPASSPARWPWPITVERPLRKVSR